MATIRQLTSLVDAVSAGDELRAGRVLSDVASAEERRGHHRAARRIRSALPDARLAPAGAGVPMYEDSALPLAALTPVQPECGLDAVELPSPPRGLLGELVREWSLRACLAEKAVERRSRLLFHGPPGSGKSLTARALGHEVGLPVFVVRYDALIGALLGQTALRLQMLFDFAAARPCVLVLDEVDAVGRRRGDPLDVGELDRIAITMMQALEHSKPAGFVIATSNLARALDDALWRRFDVVVPFRNPPRSQLRAFTLRRLADAGLAASAAVRARIAACRCYADAVRLVDDEKRRRILEEGERR